MKLLSWLLSKLPCQLLISALLKNENVAAINVHYWKDIETMAREVEPINEYH